MTISGGRIRAPLGDLLAQLAGRGAGPLRRWISDGLIRVRTDRQGRASFTAPEWVGFAAVALATLLRFADRRNGPRLHAASIEACERIGRGFTGSAVALPTPRSVPVAFYGSPAILEESRAIVRAGFWYPLGPRLREAEEIISGARVAPGKE